jgi:outer membrane receptor protein involved in Fe transport
MTARVFDSGVNVRNILHGFGLLLCTAALSSIAFAQGTTGAIEVAVTDSSGSVVPGANARAISEDTGAEISVNADRTGICLFAMLRPGRYRVVVESSGFQKLQRDGVILNATERVRLDLVLAVGGISQTVNVTETTPLLQSERATMGHVIERETITSAPLATRNFTQLLGTSAGVVGAIYNADQPGAGSDSVSVNGARRGSNNILVDGATVSNSLNNAPEGDGTPSLEFLSEFKILTSLYGAEYGRNLGSVINVTTRSGSNQFHGAAYDFFRNTALNARPFFSPARGQNNQNQFGANVGGPIRRNKTFFFAGWESFRQRNANSGAAVLTAVLPTAAQRQGIFSTRITDPSTGSPFPNNTIPSSRLNPVGIKITDAFMPLPNYSAGGAVNFFAAQTIATDLNQYTTRIDHRFSDKDSVFGRYFRSGEGDTQPFNGGLPGFGNAVNRRKNSLNAVHTHVFSPTVVLESSVAYDQTDLFTTPQNLTDMASLGLHPLPVTLTDQGPAQFNLSNYVNFGYYQTTADHVKSFAGSSNLTWIRGSHNVKFGLETVHDLYSPMNTNDSRGRFFFTGDATGNAYADFLLSIARTKNFGAGPGTFKMRDAVMAGYANDEWKVTPSLTVNLGVRYEAYWQPAAYNLAMTNFYPERYRGVGSLEASGIVQGGVNGVPMSTVQGDWNNFMPRVGVAWRAGGGWVIRTGAGLYFDQRTGQVAQQMFKNPPAYKSIRPDCAVAGSPCNMKQPDNYTFLDPGYDPNSIPFPTSVNDAFAQSAIDPDTKTDSAWQYNFNLQRQLPHNLLIETAYVGTKGTHLTLNRNINPQIPVGFNPSNPKSGALVRLFPGFADIGTSTQGGNSTYHSFQTTAKMRINSATVQAAYTFGKTLSNASEGPRYYTGVFTTPWWDWSRAKGPAQFDRSHRVSVLFTQQLPSAFRGGVGKFALNSWSLSGVIVAQTGTPLTVTNRTSGQGLGGAAATPTDPLFANVVAGAELVNPGSTKSHLTNYINKAAWSPAPSGTVGSSGRGMFRGPGQANFDLSLAKDFPVHERFNLQFRSEFFNLLNHANFGNPNTSMDAANFGQISGTTVNARLIQFALKLHF